MTQAEKIIKEIKSKRQNIYEIDTNVPYAQLEELYKEMNKLKRNVDSNNEFCHQLLNLLESILEKIDNEKDNS